MPFFTGSHQTWMISTAVESRPRNTKNQARPAVAEINTESPQKTKGFKTRRHLGVPASQCPRRIVPTAVRPQMIATSNQ